MNKKIKRSRMMQYTIAVIAALIILITGPLGLIKHHLTLKSTEVTKEMTDPVSVDDFAMQMFIPQCEEIKRLSVYVCSENANTILQLRVKDAALSDLRVVEADISDMQGPGFVTFDIDLDVEIGKEYYYTVESLGEEVLLALEDTAESGVTTNGIYFFAGMEFPGVNLITRYDCVAALSPKREAAYCIGTALLAAALIALIQWLFTKKFEDKEILAGSYVRKLLNPVLAVITLGCAAAIWPVKLFSSRPLDIIVYESGVFLLAAVLFYGLNHKRDETYDFVKTKLQKYKIQDILQAVCIAEAIWYCTEYVNGLSNHAHYEAFRYVLIWLSLGMIATFTKKELLCRSNGLYVVLAAIAGFIYKKNFAGVLEEESLMMLTIYVAVFGGLVVLNVLKSLFQRKISRVNIVYALLLAMLAVLMIVFRHKWVWPIVMTVMFFIYYLRFGAWQRKKVFLDNLANGMLLSFAAVLVQSLLHRPYHYFMYIRYPLTFHTSTVTAVYLTMVLCAALAKYFSKTRYSVRLADTWKELAMVAGVAAYLIMTLSRTGYVAIFAAGAVLLIATAEGKIKEKLRKIGIQVVSLVLAIVVGMPICFTATRAIPAVVNEPFIYDIEVFVDSIVKGDEPDSRRYMTVARFVTAFNMRILGMDEKSAMIFGSDDPGYISMMNENYIFVASAEGDAGVEEAGDTIFDTSDISNGRFDIYKVYWDNLNWNGHEVMSVDGKIMHAHNIYLQTAHDSGIAAGIVLVLLNIAGVVTAYIYYRRKRNTEANACMPLAVMTAFLVAGIVEWIFHPCNPFGFVWLLTMAPLLFDMKKEKMERNEEKTL